MSKLEHGGQRPAEEDLRQWAEAVGATTQQGGKLYEVAIAARIEYAAVSQRYRGHGGAVAEQEPTTHEDASTARIAEFQPAMVPGLVQTAAYARDVLTRPCGPAASGVSTDEIEAIVGARMQRQQILYEPQQTIQLIMGEAALHTRFGAKETLLGQLDRLTALASYSGVEIGVVPFAAAMPIFPLTNFLLNDDHVLIETLTAQHRLDSPDDVEAYENYFNELRAAAVTGQQLEQLLHGVASTLRAAAAIEDPAGGP